MALLAGSLIVSAGVLSAPAGATVRRPGTVAVIMHASSRDQMRLPAAATAKTSPRKHTPTKKASKLKPVRSRPNIAGLTRGGHLPAPPATPAAAQRELTTLIASVPQGLADLGVMEASLRAAGVTIYNGNRLFASAVKASSPEMWIQAGAIQGLAELSTDTQSRPMSSLLKLLVAAEPPQLRHKLTAAAYRSFFARAINQPSTAPDRMWSALVQADPIPGQNITGALARGTNVQLSALQIDLLLMRLRSDALAAAVQAAHNGLHSGKLQPFKPHATAAAESTCAAINELPDSVVAGFNALHGRIGEIFIELQGEGFAEAYGPLSALVSFANDFINYTLMLTSVQITTTTDGKLVRTKSSVDSGGRVALRSTFVMDNAAHSELLNCLGTALALGGLNFKTPETGALVGDTASWKVNSGPVAIAPPEAKTGEDGVAETKMVGERQNLDLTNKPVVAIDRKVQLTADIDPESSKPTWDRIGDQAVTAVELALGVAIPGRQLAALGKAYKELVQAAIALGAIGLLHGQASVPIQDWLTAPVLTIKLHYVRDQDLPDGAGQVSGDVVANVPLTPGSVTTQYDGLHVVWSGTGPASVVNAAGELDGSTEDVSTWLANDPGQDPGCYENSCGYPCPTQTALGSPSSTPGTVSVSDLETVYNPNDDSASPTLYNEGGGDIGLSGAMITLSGTSTVSPPCVWKDGVNTDQGSETDDIFRNFYLALSPPVGDNSLLTLNDLEEVALGAWKLPWKPAGPQAVQAAFSATDNSDPQDVRKFNMKLTIAPAS